MKNAKDSARLAQMAQESLITIASNAMMINALNAMESLIVNCAKKNSNLCHFHCLKSLLKITYNAAHAIALITLIVNFTLIVLVVQAIIRHTSV